MKSILSIGLFGFVVCSATAVAAQVVDIRIDPTTTFQTIVGWESTVELDSRPIELPRTGTRDAEIINRAIDEVGINRLRFEIRSGTENTSRMLSQVQRGEATYEQWVAERYAVVNDNNDPAIINWDGFDFTELDWQIDNAILPMLEIFEARGEKLFLNLCYVAFTEHITDGAYLHDDPEEYAEFVLATYLHMNEKYGFVPDAWEVILEPDKVHEWRRDPTLIGWAIVSTARRLKEHGFTPSFIAPSVMSMGNAVPYFDALASVPGAVQHVRELSYHRYRNGDLRAVEARARQVGINASMLELWFGRATYEVLYDDLKRGNNVAWQGRVLAGLFDFNNARDGEPLKLQEDVRYNRQYTAYVKAGAVRIEAQTSDSGVFDPLAFINPNGGQIVVIKARQRGNVTIHGLPEGSYEISYAVENGSSVIPNLATVQTGGILQASIPSRGVLTIAAVIQ